MGVENFDLDDGTGVLTGSMTYDDVTKQITRVDWDNQTANDYVVTIESANKPALKTTIRAGRSGSKTNIANGYLADPLLIEIGAS